MQKGFTLLEVMIVVAILGVLLAIAIPSYQNYVIKVKRGEMKTSLMSISQSLQRYQVANKTFANVKNSPQFQKLANASGENYPQSGQALYTVKLELNANNRDWVLTATPIAAKSQERDGHIMLNNQGHKCWTKGQSCSLSATSKWDD